MRIRNEIDNNKEPITELREVADFLAEVVSDPGRITVDNEFYYFFSTDLAGGIIRRLCKERTIHNSKVLSRTLNDLVPRHHAAYLFFLSTDLRN